MSQPSQISMPTKYDPHQTEAKWYAFWQEGKFFKPTDDPNKENIRL